MKSIAILLLTASTATADPAAATSERTGKRHLLRIQALSSSSGDFRRDTILDEHTRFAVGAAVVVHVPRVLGTGHGPFRSVYGRAATMTPRASAGLAIESIEHETFVVRCTRAGVFELFVDVAEHGTKLTDAIDIGCITPSRFVATVAGADDRARFLAGASTVYVSPAWYGRRSDGREVKLVGTLPITAPERGALALVSHPDGPRFRTLRPAITPALVSAGLRVTLPIEIVDPPTWTLAVDVATKSAISIQVRAFDARGPFAGLTECSLTSQLAGVETSHGTQCRILLGRHRAWNADRVCVVVNGKRACAAHQLSSTRSTTPARHGLEHRRGASTPPV